MYTLYGSPGSGSAAVEITLALAQIPYEQVRAASWEPGPNLDALVRINPLGQIPTLVLPDGTVLTESGAILLHLGLEHPEAGLLPVEPSRRAQALRGLVYIAANCYSVIGIIDFPERFCTDLDEVTRARMIAGCRARLHHNWEVFADLFPGDPYLNGAHPGALDAMAVVVSRWCGARAHLAAHRPAFTELLGRIEAHPVVAPVLARCFPT